MWARTVSRYSTNFALYGRHKVMLEAAIILLCNMNECFWRGTAIVETIFFNKRSITNKKCENLCQIDKETIAFLEIW